MSELILKPGPLLYWREWEFDEVTEEENYVDSDVMTAAHEYLFELVTIEKDVLLSDIFRLLDASPILIAILRRDFSDELLAEARKGASSSWSHEYAPESIEFLELYQTWHLNTATREYDPVHRLDFHGVGHLLREDFDYGNGNIYPAGTRIHWSVSTIPLRELLVIPIRVNPSISICENDLSAKKYGHELEEIQLMGVNLGQVLHGILWELSWHGGPETQSQFVDELSARVEDIKSHRPDVVSAIDPYGEEGIFEQLDEPGFQAFFQHLGAHSKKEIVFTLGDLDDDEPVQAGLRARLSEEVTIKPEFATMVARAFRTLFREAK